VITITGIGDHLRPEWPITITGMRTLAESFPAGRHAGEKYQPRNTRPTTLGAFYPTQKHAFMDAH
jgi:hypothetical protein